MGLHLFRLDISICSGPGMTLDVR